MKSAFPRNKISKYSIVAIAILLLALSLILAVLFSNWKDSEYRKNVEIFDLQRGDNLVLAIKSFEKDKGSFPEKLIELVPAYIDKLPQTVAGQDFLYSSYKTPNSCTVVHNSKGILTENHCNDGKWSFSLSFPTRSWNRCYSFNFDDTAKGFTERSWSSCDFPL